MTDSNKSIEPQVLSIKDILQMENLTIPEYQRPYKWQTDHTGQLLDDLYSHFIENKRYRIGTVVFHQEEEKNKKGENKTLLNVVDGQQRLTTLALILHFLQQDISKEFLAKEVKHSISQQNIFQNYAFIENYLRDKSDKDKFCKYILEICEMVCVILDELDEAFQFFDSQNSRGKSLKPYDLLKAYHLREMTTTDEKIIHQCVNNWEQAVEDKPLDELPNLDKIISKILFRLKRWEKNQDAKVFTGADIKVFKGVNAESEIHHPYLTAQKAALVLSQMQKDNPLLYRQEHTTPFNIQQTIINGEYFFQFVQHYRVLYDELFNKNSGLLKDYEIVKLINDYEGSGRTGDQYCKALFEATVLAFYDRFADEYLKIAVDKAFRWAYQVRLEKQSVYFVSIENHAINKDSLLKYINSILVPSEIGKFVTSFNKETCKINKSINQTKLYTYFMGGKTNEQ